MLELLIQQRHPNKYHCGGLWTNTCCGHPFPTERTTIAARRRLFEELGIQTELIYAGKFHYTANFSNGLIENEYDHVYVGFLSNNKMVINKKEILTTAWVAIKLLKEEMTKAPHKYTPWFIEALSIALSFIRSVE